MKQHKFRTYIFYAIGEIFLVVIGILIALQVNNWNEYRKAQIASDNTREDLRVELLEVKKKLISANKFNKKLLAHTEAYLNGSLKEAIVLREPGIMFKVVNYATVTFDIPILDQEMSSDQVMIEEDSLVRILRDIKSEIIRANEVRSYLEQIWNDEVIPYMVQQKAMVAVDRFFIEEISDPETSLKLFKDELYKNLSAANHSFLVNYVTISDKLLTLLDQSLHHNKD